MVDLIKNLLPRCAAHRAKSNSLFDHAWFVVLSLKTKWISLPPESISQYLRAFFFFETNFETFFFIAVVSGNFWAIWSGRLVVCVWRVNVRREPETASFLIAVPIVIATVDVWIRTRVVFIVYLSIVLTHVNSYRIVVSYWFDCFFFALAIESFPLTW